MSPCLSLSLLPWLSVRNDPLFIATPFPSRLMLILIIRYPTRVCASI